VHIALSNAYETSIGWIIVIIDAMLLFYYVAFSWLTRHTLSTAPVPPALAARETARTAASALTARTRYVYYVYRRVWQDSIADGLV